MVQETYDTWIQKVHRQHNSLLVVVPYLMCKRIGIKAGDYLEFSRKDGSKIVKVTKVRLQRESNGKSRTSTDRKNKGGDI